jgi:hypothetical protein
VKLASTNRSTPKADKAVISVNCGTPFTNGQTGLHLLSYLLTGNHEDADRCFVPSLLFIP